MRWQYFVIALAILIATDGSEQSLIKQLFPWAMIRSITQVFIIAGAFTLVD